MYIKINEIYIKLQLVNRCKIYFLIQTSMNIVKYTTQGFNLVIEVEAYMMYLPDVQFLID